MALTACCGLAAGPGLGAQVPEEPRAQGSAAIGAQASDDAEGGIRVFPPDYFTEFDPITALDMVYRTPGFNPQESDGGRGLSSVRSNILIDGERPPPKGQSAREQLGDMPIERVERLELIDAGARLGVDMQGYDQVINVITKANPPAYYEIVTSVRREGTGDERQDNERSFEIGAMGSFFWRQHEFTLQADLDDSGSRSPSGLVAIDPANPEQRVTGLNRRDGSDRGLELNANLALPNDSSISVNGRFSSEDGASFPVDFEAEEEGAGAISETFADEEQDRDIAAEYRRPFGPGGGLTFALVDSASTEHSTGSLIAEALTRSSREDSESGETAARVMITRSPTDRLTLRVIATAAYNYFDGGFRLFENGVEQVIEGSDSRVEEDRRALETALDWNLSERWTLRAALGGEVYEIRSHDLSSGSQSDPKGEISIAFRPRPRTTLSFESSRAIGQLSFGQFLASSSLSSEILTAGATALEPERTRSHAIRYDRRFGDAGVLRFNLSRDEVENPVRSVALSDSVIVAQNAFPETIDEIGASVEFPFERLGHEELILSANVRFADSATIDPVTGVPREVSGLNSRFWSLGLRRDPGDGKLAWGMSISHRTQGLDYSVRRIRDSSFSRDWDAYVEWEPIEGLKLRTSLDGPSSRIERTRFFPAVRAPGLTPSFFSRSFRESERSASFSVEWRRRDNLEIIGNLSTQPKVREEEALAMFGAPFDAALATETARTPQAQVQFRFYR